MKHEYLDTMGRILSSYVQWHQFRFTFAISCVRHVIATDVGIAFSSITSKKLIILGSAALGTQTHIHCTGHTNTCTLHWAHKHIYTALYADYLTLFLEQE